jgi:hypothetical protein
MIRPTALALIPGALFILTACTSTPPPPPVGGATISYTKGVPGGVILQTFEVTATVTALDLAQREATLLGPDGKKFVVTVAAEAVNFDQVRVGDQVKATVTEKVVASVEKAGAAAGEGAASLVALAPKGARPGGAAAETLQLTAKVVAIDASKRTATLRFDNGASRILPVREDVDLSQRQVGETVVFRITELVAISLTKP